MTEVCEQYLDISRYLADKQGNNLILQTALGLTPEGLIANPTFFDGLLLRGDIAAAGLRTLVEIASTRYFNPIPGGFASLDPVMTANGDRLRCEAFSACNGVYARLDLLAESLGHSTLGFGTTNIDINPPLYHALSGIHGGKDLHLNVGPKQVTMRTADNSYTERKVKLPERWVRALAETQALATTLEHRHTLDLLSWRRFIGSISMSPSRGSGAGDSLWLVPVGKGFRQTSRPTMESISLAGTARLSAVKRLQHFIQEIRVYSPKLYDNVESAISAWEFSMPGVRLTLMLSPKPCKHVLAAKIFLSNKATTS